MQTKKKLKNSHTVSQLHIDKRKPEYGGHFLEPSGCCSGSSDFYHQTNKLSDDKS